MAERVLTSELVKYLKTAKPTQETEQSIVKTNSTLTAERMDNCEKHTIVFNILTMLVKNPKF